MPFRRQKYPRLHIFRLTSTGFSDPGGDIIILTETTAVTDIIITTVGTAYTLATMDSITGFAAGIYSLNSGSCQSSTIKITNCFACDSQSYKTIKGQIQFIFISSTGCC